MRTLLVVLKAGPLPSYAGYTLLRAAFEADVRARHLLDTMISEKELVARSLNERWDSLVQQRKALPTNVRAPFNQRMAQIERVAAENGIEVVRSAPRGSSAGKIVGFGERQQTEIELFERYLPAGSLAFRFLSGIVHSKLWALVPASFAEPTSDPNLVEVTSYADGLLFVSLVAIVLELREEVTGLWLALAGYDPDVWEAAKPPRPDLSLPERPPARLTRSLDL